LPQAEAGSLDDQASAFLIDADTGSPDAFTKMPVIVQWQADSRRVALRPADGHPLTPGRRYAAVITRRVKDTKGQQLEPAPKFASIRDPNLVLTDARLNAARTQYTPVLETLVKSGLPRTDISAMAVFHVQNIDQDLVDARRTVRTGKAPVPTLSTVVSAADLDARLGTASGAAGFDDSGAAPHENLYAMVHGTLPSPNLLSATAKTHGKFERDSTGALRVKRTDEVPFTLFVPRSALEAPIVIYQHQRDRERSDALAIANELASHGIATLAIDAPFQGMRANTPEKRKSVDWRNRFTGAETPDGFGDAPGDFLGFAKATGGTAWNPLDGRDAMRQGVIDLMVAVRSIEDGSLVAATAAAADSGLKERTFVRMHVGFVGEDTGASLGAMLARIEPSVQVVVLVSPAGATVTQWAWSANDEDMFSTIATSLGFDLDTLDRTTNDPAFWPGLAIYQTLFDRADPLAHAAALRRAAVNVLVLMAEDDESVSNRATEGYAASLGTSLIGSDARYVGDLMRADVSDDEGAGGNYNASGNRVTRTTYVYSPATHDFLQARTDTERYAHPPEAPFEPLSQPMSIMNPTSAAARQIGLYLQSFFSCAKDDASLPNTACSASP
jgi:hypothetical protein